MKTNMALAGVVLAGSLLARLAGQAEEPALPAFDFTRAGTAGQWGQPHHISALQPISDGLEMTISGEDPYLFGPASNYPEDVPLWLILRLWSDQSGTGEVFYFQRQAESQKSVRFNVKGGTWTEARVPMPALGPKYRLRLDPPGREGRVVLASLRFESRTNLPEPVWPLWQSPEPGRQKVMAAGALELFMGTNAALNLELRLQGHSLASGHPRLRIGYERQKQVRWLDLSGASWERQRSGQQELTLTARALDPDGGEWIYRNTFRTDSPGAIRTETTVQVNEDRAVVFLPMHLLVAGEKSFGRRKGQGLLAGLEYLEDEPSSSEADIVGPESNRRVPSSYKLTFPLMAIEADQRYVGLIWDNPTQFSALFDSPDRIFGSGGHVLGVIFPGSEGVYREEGRLLPYSGLVLKANQQLASRAWYIGGAGRSLTSAVKHYVSLRGLPDRPETGLSLTEYVKLAAHGWLASKCRESNLYRHAVWPGFHPQPAADAAVFETWLAGRAAELHQSNALRQAASQALSAVPPEAYYHSAIGHVRTPAAALVFGSVQQASDAAERVARSQLNRFTADGSIPYRAGANGPDYGKTHFAPDANGLTAQVVATLLEAAAFCGDRDLIAQAVSKLRELDRFRDTVPRGAQTWEVPLHTPDILASAHLVRVYTLGYELTGDKALLDQAIDWAWTGVPFVYLVNPTGQPVGPYSTIAVLGATGWKAPVWFGRPVQWCGMVYADALYRLAAHDPAGPWQQLAEGITCAGLQLSWPVEDPERGGLLPDFFELPSQIRAGPAINPATVGSGAVRLYGQETLYTFRAFPRGGFIVHAPGSIVPGPTTDQRTSFTVRGWPTEPYYVLITGLDRAPAVTLNGRAVSGEFHAAQGRLILKVTGQPHLELTP